MRSPVTPRKYSIEGMVQRNEAGVRRLPLTGSTMQHWVRKVSALSAGTRAKVSVPRMRVKMKNQGAGPLKPMALNSRLLRRTGASGELVSWMYMVYRSMDLNLYFYSLFVPVLWISL